MGRVCVLRSVRVYFKKKDRLKFVSHLDMNRFMTRILNLSKIPLWYTEGFNPHPYLTFLLPLSLGFESDCEIMEIRIIDDTFSNEAVKFALQKVSPEYIEIFDVRDAILKAGKIAYAQFMIKFPETDAEFSESLKMFLSQKSIEVTKTGKKGKVSVIDLAPKIKHFDLRMDFDSTYLDIILPAGGSDNINPSLLLKAYGDIPSYKVTRTMIYDENMNQFQ